MDPVHAFFLHTMVSGPQFPDTWGVRGDLEYYDGAFSLYCTLARRVEENVWLRLHENILPNVTQSGAVHSIDGRTVRYFGRNVFFRWCLPVDDTHTKVVAWANFGDRTDPVEWNTPDNIEILEQGELFDRAYEEVQKRPADYEAVVGQGPIAVHAMEHMGTSDKGVALFRRRLRRDMRALLQGRQPIQPTAFGPAPIPTWAGDNVLRAPARDDMDDRELKAQMFAQLFEIYRDSARMRGEERDQFIIERLKALEAA